MVGLLKAEAQNWHITLAHSIDEVNHETNPELMWREVHTGVGTEETRFMEGHFAD